MGLMRPAAAHAGSIIPIMHQFVVIMRPARAYRQEYDIYACSLSLALPCNNEYNNIKMHLQFCVCLLKNLPKCDVAV
jgi:hypothetical protein